MRARRRPITIGRRPQAHSIYDPHAGLIRVGRCFLCGKKVSNYKRRIWGRTFRTIYVKNYGYCHNSCYNKWNPVKGICRVCGDPVRRRTGTYRNGEWFHLQCFRELEVREQKRKRVEGRWRIPKRQVEEKHERPAITILATPIVKLATKKILMYGLTSTIPLAREIYAGYLLAKGIYNTWDTIYSYLKTTEERRIEEATYDYLRGEAVEGLTTYQTGIIWGKVEGKIPEPYQDLAHEIIENVMGNVSEEEISIVEQALQYL